MSRNGKRYRIPGIISPWWERVWLAIAIVGWLVAVAVLTGKMPL